MIPNTCNPVNSGEHLDPVTGLYGIRKDLINKNKLLSKKAEKALRSL